MLGSVLGRAMAGRKPTAECKRFRCPSQMFDTDHSGEIDEDEFAMLLEYLGIELSEEEMEKMFKRFDTVRELLGLLCW